MQTFLPYPSFEKSAAVLDSKRLQKQIVECKQIYLALTELNYGWKNHPAVKMWKGYEGTLCQYALICHNEWSRRYLKVHKLMQWFLDRVLVMGVPAWFGNETFHISHQSNLLRKDFEYYHPFFGDIPTDLPYFWPTQDGYK